ncbi:SET domain-containing protein [Auricularia subglabra TFB-10046 SS5]|uniref:SET domain-containing protein n=1 Tax=Auricularia subglabra (strain TFB-10046 / SS5) TaxID=717982 RepID=J0WTF6_AURST|nr:SET domain-containing protein [Auricularia subglabra TFB-10046 SS5]
MRQLFEHVMSVNTMHDEPDAPPITVDNKINDDPCPPWEFYYTNKLFYGQNVKRGDSAKLKGCDCVGGCRPDSKTCSCLRRQHRYLRLHGESPPLQFNYDQNGRVIYLDYPIFECNDACGCDESCMNRVVQRGRQFPVEIANTRKKGWGVFAKSDIPAHSFVGVYSGELITDREAHARAALYDLVGRTYLFAIEMWYLKNIFRRRYRERHRPDTIAPDDGEPQLDDEKQSSIFVVDAFHVGNFTRFLNHCCEPNCTLVTVHINEPHLYKPYPCLFTEKDVKAGEELTFSYCGPISEEEVCLFFPCSVLLS